MNTQQKGSTLTLLLRTTVVAGIPSEFPDIRVEKSRLISTETGTWFISEGEHTFTKLPPDFYLAGRELSQIGYDPDLDQLSKFVSEWGLFADPHDRDLRHDEIGVIFESISDGYLHPRYELDERGNPERSFERAKRETLVELGLLKSLETYPKGLEGKFKQFVDYGKLLDSGFRIVNVSELTQRLFHLKQFADFYEALGEENPSWAADLPSVYASFNVALSVFSVHLVIPDFAHADQHPTLFNVAALQIANDILLGVTKRKCANENCDHEFTRQRGRAQYGEYRLKEVFYCSTSCARAQAQRNLRRRRATQKALSATAGSKSDPELREQPEV